MHQHDWTENGENDQNPYRSRHWKNGTQMSGKKCQPVEFVLNEKNFIVQQDATFVLLGSNTLLGSLGIPE